MLSATELNQKSYELLPQPLFSPVSFCSELSGEIISTKPLKANAALSRAPKARRFEGFVI